MVGTTRSSGAGTTHDAEVRFGPDPQVLRAVRPQCGGTPIARPAPQKLSCTLAVCRNAARAIECRNG
jgi:hypothetical protein